MGALLIWAGSAYCQSTAPAAPTDQSSQNAAPSPAEEGQLQEVVVTAEIRAESAQSTPISMSVVTGNSILENNEVDLADLQFSTPDFTVNTEGGNLALVNIRGIGYTAVIAGVTPGVAVLKDGLLDDEAVGGSVTGDFYDVANISVLKGPQGTFIGAAAIGGAVEIQNQIPEFGSQASGYVDGQVGNYSDLKTTGAINMPVTDTLAMRLAFNYETMGSFARDIGAFAGENVPGSPPDNVYKNNGSTQFVTTDPGSLNNRNARLQLLWKPTGNFEALLKLETNQAQTYGNDEQISPATYINPITLAVTHAPLYNETLHAGPWVYDQYLPDQSIYTLLNVYMADLKYTFPDQIQLRSLSGVQNTGVLSYTSECAPCDVYTGYSNGGVHPDPYYSQEFDVISPTSWRVNFVAGASWFYRSTAQDNYAFNATVPTDVKINNTLTGPYTSVQRIMGVYANINWQILPTLQLQAGGRLNIDRNYNFGVYETVNTDAGVNAVTNGFVCAAPCSATKFYNLGQMSDNIPTGKIGLNWTPTEGQLVYGFLARGYKPGALQTGSPKPTPQPSAVPETDYDFEVGWKGSALNKHLQTDIDAYYMRYFDLQEQVESPATGAQLLLNLGSPSTIYGLEVALNGSFGNFIVSLGGDYDHSALGSLRAINPGYLPPIATNEPQCAPGQTINCFNYNAVGPTGLGYYANLSGEEGTLSPLYSLNATLGYNIRIGNGRLTPEVTWTYVAHQYSNIFQQNQYYYIQPYGLVNANLTYTGGPWLVELYGKNVFNRLYEEGNNGSYVFYGNPLQYGMRLQYTF
jgi:iron complex outermembrane receptor protein